MPNILVSGYYGFYNAGDEAILAGLIQSMRALDPAVNFTVISGTAAYTRALHGVDAVSRDDSGAIWRAMGEADLLISGGGSLLQDITSSKSLIYYLGIVTMAKLRRRPVMFYAQGIGPVAGTIGKTLVPLVVNRVDRIGVRDPESADALKALGVKPDRINVTADAALALGPSDPEWGGQLLAAHGVDLSRPIIGVSVRPWRGQGAWEIQLAQALEQVARESGAQVVFLPMHQLRSNDVEAARAVAQHMSAPTVIIQGDDLTHNHLRAMIARCDLLIGMRYHALVFAAMNGVPLVGVSYDPKNDSFLRLIGEQAAGATDRMEAAVVADAARRALADAPSFRARLAARMAELTPMSRRNAELALELLQARSKR